MIKAQTDKIYFGGKVFLIFSLNEQSATGVFKEGENDSVKISEMSLRLRNKKKHVKKTAANVAGYVHVILSKFFRILIGRNPTAIPDPKKTK